VTFAAGLATEGFKPFCAIYSTFLSEALTRSFTTCDPGPAGTLAIDRAGWSAPNGATHAGSFDNAYLGRLPGFVIMAALGRGGTGAHGGDQVVIKRSPQCAALSARRRPRRGNCPNSAFRWRSARAAIVREGTKVALLSFGTRLGECEKAADELAAHGLSNHHRRRPLHEPLDVEMVLRLAREHEILLAIEEARSAGSALT